MPLSARVKAAGILMNGRHGFVLQADGGGFWELGHVRGAKALLGGHVQVEGTRCGFDAITCRRLWCTGEARPRLPLFDPETFLLGTLIVAGLAASVAWFLA